MKLCSAMVFGQAAGWGQRDCAAANLGAHQAMTPCPNICLQMRIPCCHGDMANGADH